MQSDDIFSPLDVIMRYKAMVENVRGMEAKMRKVNKVGGQSLMSSK